MKKPIVVLTVPTLQGNGAERVVLTLAKGLEQQGCEVHIILTLKNIVELESDGQFQIHYFKQYYRWIPKSIRGQVLAPLLDRFIVKICGSKPNLVLSNLEPSDIMLCHSKFNTYLIIHSAMSEMIDCFKRDKIEQSKIYTKKPVICVSKGVKEDFDKVFDSQFPSYAIYNSIDVDFIKQKSIEFKSEYSDYLVHVGKFNDAKRHDILIKAYAKSGIDSHLVLVGRGPLKQECEVLVDKLGLNDKVIFVGFQSNPYPFIKQAKLMVLSSGFEGFGMVIAEALALNTPAISTDCPSGPSEILPRGNLVPTGDVDALANKIVDAVKSPVEYAVNLKKDFTLEYQAKKYLQLIKR